MSDNMEQSGNDRLLAQPATAVTEHAGKGGVKKSRE